MTPAEEQIQQLVDQFPGTSWLKNPDGSYVVTIPDVKLPTGWNAKETTVRFVLPVGYPISRPDCFWTNPELRLASGSIPQNTGNNQLPGSPTALLWFSWHVTKWSPNHDTVLTYFRVIMNRFNQLK